MLVALGRPDLMVLTMEALLLLACAVWVLASLVRTVGHILAVQRRRSSLAKRHGNLERDLETVRHSVRQQESALHTVEKALETKQEELEVAEAALALRRGNGLPEYQMLTERFGDKDKLWLMAVPQAGKPARWAVAAPDARTAAELLAKKVSAAAPPAVEGQL